MIHSNCSHKGPSRKSLDPVVCTKWTRPLDQGSIFFFNINPLVLWAMDQGDRGMRLTPFFISGSIVSGSFHPPMSHDLWGPNSPCARSYRTHQMLEYYPIYMHMYVYVCVSYLALGQTVFRLGIKIKYMPTRYFLLFKIRP